MNSIEKRSFSEHHLREEIKRPRELLEEAWGSLISILDETRLEDFIPTQRKYSDLIKEYWKDRFRTAILFFEMDEETVDEAFFGVHKTIQVGVEKISLSQGSNFGQSSFTLQIEANNYADAASFTWGEERGKRWGVMHISSRPIGDLQTLAVPPHVYIYGLSVQNGLIPKFERWQTMKDPITGGKFQRREQLGTPLEDH